MRINLAHCKISRFALDSYSFFTFPCFIFSCITKIEFFRKKRKKFGWYTRYQWVLFFNSTLFIFWLELMQSEWKFDDMNSPARCLQCFFRRRFFFLTAEEWFLLIFLHVHKFRFRILGSVHRPDQNEHCRKQLVEILKNLLFGFLHFEYLAQSSDSLEEK